MYAAFDSRTFIPQRVIHSLQVMLVQELHQIVVVPNEERHLCGKLDRCDMQVKGISVLLEI